MNKKYFFFDIDGTLTDKSRNIAPSAKLAIQQLKANGHFVAVATGRAHYKTKELTDPLGITDLVCNGGCCLVHDGEMFQDLTLDIDLAKQVLRHADENDIGWMLMLDDSDKIYMKDLKFLSRAGRKNEQTTHVYDETLDFEKLDRIYKIYLALTKEQQAQYEWIDLLPHLRYSPVYMFFEQDEKKAGILKMLKKVGGDPSDVVVCGDGKNDLCMFDDRWFNIAMGNANQALKDKADYVTESNENEGVLKACQHFGWI